FQNLLPQTLQLKGKVYDEKKNPVKNFTLRFSSFGNITTTNSGEFVIELPDNLTSVEIEVPDKKWTLLFPIDFKVPIPNDKNYVTKIVVASNESLTNEKLENAAKNYNKLESLLKEIGVAKDELKNLVENYAKKESENINVQEDSLKQAILNEKKREKFDIISQIFLKYIVKLQNLKDEFKLLTQLAFENSRAFQEIIKSIEAYNAVFNEINNNKFSFQKDISDYWENENLADNFSETVDYGLDEIHKTYILKLNDYIVGINKITTGQIHDSDERKETRENLSQGISSVVRELEIRIPIFEKKITTLIIKLKDSV
ncbi:MAG: hypothetical protein ABI550_05940, partial [Ignavibacteriaceae bacterium]